MADVLPYASVNDAINEVFFDGRFTAQPVYLSMDNALRSEVASRLSIDPDDANDAICDAVRATLPNSSDPYRDHASAAARWREKGMRTAPPFSAVLYSLAYAAELMEEEGRFASNNYYIRLQQVTDIERDLLKRGMKRTEPLWLALNEWLVANNHVLGRPTAFTNGSTWRYVDWPVSQAIVRASDRDRFHDLFERYGFSGSESPSRREMGHYLDGWMRSGRANGRLKNAWSKKELRDRVSEAAIAELATWNATGNKGTAGKERRTAKLSLLANIAQRITGPSLELHLGFLGEQDEPAILGSRGTTYQLANDSYGSFATISPSPFQAGNSALGQDHSFMQAGSERSLGWEPRLVIPLVRSPQGSLWVEAMRVTFGVPHLLLVRDTNNLPRKVEQHLAQAMTTQPTIALPEDLKGLPYGWVLYNDVTISRTVDAPSSNDLDTLIPLDDGGVMEVTGGLKLLPRFYHASSRPVVRLAVPSGQARIDAVPMLDDEVLSSIEGKAGVSLALDPTTLGHGDLELRGYQDGKLVEREEVFFRDASHPTLLHRAGHGLLSYQGMVSATQREAEGMFVSGMVATGDIAALPATTSSEWAPLGTPQGGHDESGQEAAYARAIELQVSRQACIEKGYHVWRFPMVPDDTPRGTPFEGRCTSCDQPLIIVFRPKRKMRQAPPRPVVHRKLEAMRLPTAPRQDALDHDLLLDALSFLGKGSWGGFESLLDSMSPDQQYVRQVAQQLSFLGHLDLELRPGPGAIKSWSVPAPAVNYTSNTSAFLSGFRCSTLLEQLREAVGQGGGRVSSAPMAGGPTAITVDGITPVQLQGIADTIQDPHGRSIIVNDSSARRLAAACLALPPLDAWLHPVSIGRARNLQRFDLREATWKDMERVSGSGCYRWNESYQAYAYVDSEGAAKAGPYQLTKLLAARASGTRLHTYDRKACEFMSALGCEPPGLLSRVLVACSGTLPTRKGSMLVHAGVPADVAQAILTMLYPGGK